MRGPALATTSRQLQPQHPRRGLLGAPPPPAQGLSSTSSSTTTTTTTTTASLGAGSSLLRPTAAARKRAQDEASLRRQRKNDREDRRWEEPSVAWVHTIRPTAEDDAAAQEGSSGERQASLPVTEEILGICAKAAGQLYCDDAADVCIELLCLSLRSSVCCVLCV